MKQVLLLLILAFSFNLQARKDTIITYFDSDWDKTSKDEAIYFRKAFKLENGKWAVIDYFSETGEIQMTGTFLDRRQKRHDGHFTYYYENGNREYEGDYVKGWRYNEWIFWYETGKKKMQGNYNKGVKEGLWQGWYTSGGIDYEVNRTAGKREGIAKYYFENGQMSAKKLYKDGELEEVDYWNEDGSKLGKGEKGEMDPEFVGGEQAMGDFIREKVVYPQRAVEQGKQGTSYVSFIVEKDGSLSEIKIIKSSHYLLDNEAIRVIKLMPAWIPGKIHNRLVRFRFNLPIKFNLG